ncbi:MAG: sigma-54 dependent transcriptional regulator [bacterium]
MAKVLIIDDDQKMCSMLSFMVKRKGYDVTCVNTLDDGHKKALSEVFDVVFLDVQMPDGNGLDMLPKLRATSSSPEVIIITGAGDPDGAELAIKSGAWDYIEKPSSIQAMTLPLVRAIQYREGKKTEKQPAALRKENIIGSSPLMEACFDLLAQAANSEASVLITGETGTGKELFARAIHENSSRAQSNFVVVDCAALPETLVESVLFGHEKGAFTGADRARSGLISQADGGTLFLDEVGELPLSLQKAFLRVLQEHHFRPLGSKQEVESDFRLVAATNQNLDYMVEKGQFRKDLLFRLRSFIIELPPLRGRSEDMKELARYHMNRLCTRYGIEPKNFAPEFFDAMLSYNWPGNVRELVNTIERTLAAAGHDRTLFPRHLPTYIRIHIAKASLRKDSSAAREDTRDSAREGIKENTREDIRINSTEGSREKTKPVAGEKSVVNPDSPTSFPTLGDFRSTTMAEAESRYLHDLMLLTGGNIKEACVRSGLSRSRLYALLKQHGVSNFS